MNKIGIISNNENDKAIKVAKDLYDYLVEKHIKVSLLAGDVMPDRYDLAIEDKGSFNNDLDAIISIGGDGTFLRASGYSFEKEIPIMGINLGNLGFLAEINKSRVKDAVNKLLKKEYRLEKRSLIECTSKGNIPLKRYLALNEFVICKSQKDKVININIIINDFEFIELVADGVIISTPTGSTAYSLSSGGPVVEPDNELLMVTPISPHSLFDRSMILKKDSSVKIIAGSKSGNIVLSRDGVKYDFEIDENEFRFNLSKKYLNLIVIDEENFFKIFKEKLINRH